MTVNALILPKPASKLGDAKGTVSGGICALNGTIHNHLHSALHPGLTKTIAPPLPNTKVRKMKRAPPSSIRIRYGKLVNIMNKTSKDIAI